jgi:signal peptide peptidase SppA
MPDLLRRTVDAAGRFVPARFRRGIQVVPVVRLTGVIGMGAPLRPGLSLATMARSLDRAFAVHNARAVALAINSPGGSPAQSHLIYRRIRLLAEEKGIPVIAYVEDVGASGGYMLACAADEIVADQFSIVGSIGVIGGTFGFNQAIAKIGIERRVYTSGDRKAMLDPFLPEKPEDVEKLKTIQKEIHERFIALVKQSRGARLNGADATLFSGEYWTASAAQELGLIDRIGDLRTDLRIRFGDKVLTPLIAAERSWLGRKLSGVKALDDIGRHPGLADELISALETRAWWARYGL